MTRKEVASHARFFIVQLLFTISKRSERRRFPLPSNCPTFKAHKGLLHRYKPSDQLIQGSKFTNPTTLGEYYIC
jgi:hypothetical protein